MFNPIFRIYGMPKLNICDRDPIFTNKSWKDI